MVKVLKKQILFRFIEKYRRLLFAFHGYTSESVLPSGTSCHVEDPTMEITHGDVVHPCVRYIETGFEGHKWWMVYTPYYAENDKLENPRLCYADAKVGDVPSEWRFYCTIVNTPHTGYNSDPTLLYNNGLLYVFWRENNTPKAENYGYTRLVVGCVVKNRTISFLSNYQLMEASLFFDKTVCPTFIKRNGGYRAYAIHVRWDPIFVYRLPSSLASKLYKYKIILLIDALGFCDKNKSYGVSIWDSDSLNETFDYIKTIQFEKSSRLYQPWHMDIFDSIIDNRNDLYAVVQSRQRHARICLAKSNDGETFRFYKRPLLTSKTTKMIGLYKSTALQVGEKLYLFYTVLDNNDGSLHKLFVTSIDWKCLIEKVDDLED